MSLKILNVIFENMIQFLNQKKEFFGGFDIYD